MKLHKWTLHDQSYNAKAIAIEKNIIKPITCTNDNGITIVHLSNMG